MRMREKVRGREGVPPMTTAVYQETSGMLSDELWYAAGPQQLTSLEYTLGC